MALDELIDRLYGLPLPDFTAARNEAAKELRVAGDRDGAETVKALRKPTAGAAAVNRLVREHRDDVEVFLRAAATLRDAQFSGKGDLGAAGRQEQAALDRLVRAGGEDVRQSLLAAAVDDEAARQVLEGRLVHELEPAGFGTLLAHVTPSGQRLQPAPKARTKPSQGRARVEQPAGGDRPARDEEQPDADGQRKTPAPKAPDAAAARTRLEDAKTALEAAEAEERQARRHWDDTRREVDKARRAVEQALDDLDRLSGD